jgi:glycosyltransferase involved in cell wall biosynthesis
MRLLHVGSGFRPWRRGGLVAYVEDLMDEQVRRGHEVSYFFSGRHYPLLRGPRLRGWEQRGVAMHEVLNSPLYDHGRQPELEVAEPRTEALLRRVLAEVEPDAVHVQELAGLPFSALDVIRESGIPSVVTLQDYFPLCSTFKLLDAGGRVCLRREIGADCVATNAADPRDPGLMVEATIKLHLRRTPLVRSHEAAIHRVATAVARRATKPPPPAPGAAYQRRRESNLARLNRADRLIAMSHRVSEIYAQLGVERDRLQTIHLTLAHIEHLTPRRAHARRPITFGTLAGFESEAKGALLLVEAMRLLREHAPAGSYRLLVLGHADPRFAALARDVPGIEIGDRFAPRELDSILDGIDVGLMPSIWEEAYGYAGVEFLAKGIPVLANAIGGMPDYTRDGETGWLNKSCSAEGLAELMAGIVERPEQIAELNAQLRENRDAIVKPMSRHADEMDAVYEELVQR